jgi:gas vesicle protein
MDSEDAGLSVAWFLVGVAVGGSIALLYAPRTGKDMRRMIAKKTEQSRDALTDSGKDVLDRGRELFDRAREVADEAADTFERARNLVRG